MSDEIVIACPGCRRKLRLSRRPSAGQQLQCPKCQHKIVFQAQKPKSPAKNPRAERPAPAKQRPERPRRKKPRHKKPLPAEETWDDDLFGGGDLHDEGEAYSDDYGDDFDDGDDSPRPASTRGRTKSLGRKKSKKKSSGSWAPFIVGFGIVAGVAMAGSLVYMFLPSGGAGILGGSGFKADLRLLPASSEVVVHVDVQGLLQGPLKGLMNRPEIREQMAEIQKESGSDPEDVETITIGASRIDGPEPNVVVIVRTKSPMTLKELKQQMPGAQPAESPYADSMLRVPQGEMEAIWLRDAQTIVGGSAEAVLQVVQGGTSIGSPIDLSLTDTSSKICGVFAPRNPPETFGANSSLQPPPMMPVPGLVDFLKSMQQTQAIGFAVDISSNIDVTVKFRSSSSEGASRLSKSFSQMLDGIKPMINPILQSAPPEIQASAAEAKKAMESLKVSSSGSTMTLSLSMPDAGDTMARTLAEQLLPAILTARGAATRTQSSNSLKQIMLAMHNYHDVHGRFPPATDTDASGRPLFSWRVHLLPFVEQSRLYEQFHLDEPWDSPHNRALGDRMPEIFELPGTPLPPGKTVYLAVIGSGTVMQPGESSRIRDITDGSSNTIMLVEANASRAVTWTAPEDYPYSPNDPLAGLGGNRPEGFHIALADGAVRLIPLTINPADLLHLFQMNDGNAIAF